MESQPCIFLGIKVKPGAIERHKIENFAVDNTVTSLKSEAEKKTNIPSSSLELIHHGKILKDEATLQDCGVKNGEMVHVLKKKTEPPTDTSQTYTDADIPHIITALRTFGCTPSAPGWTRAMQVLNDEATMEEITDAVPSLSEDCVSLSLLHEIELLAALGTTAHTMRRGGQAHPTLIPALRQLIRIVRTQSNNGATENNVPTSGFAYSLEALSEDEDVDDEEESAGGSGAITQEQLAAALQAATAVSASGGRVSEESLLRYLQGREPGSGSASAPSSGDPAAQPTAGGSRGIITPDMFSEAISEAMNLANSSSAAGTPMEQSTTASTSHSPGGGGGGGSEDFTSQLRHMHEMGLLDDAINVRALTICSGDVNAAINLVFSGAIE